jgi:hypothetical protein
VQAKRDEQNNIQEGHCFVLLQLQATIFFSHDANFTVFNYLFAYGHRLELEGHI